jgi:hypothetical protein
MRSFQTNTKLVGAGFLAAILMLALSSCGNPGLTGTADPESPLVAADMSMLADSIMTIEAGISLMADLHAPSASRAISPGSMTPSFNGYEVFYTPGGQMRTPAQVYADNGGTGLGGLRLPATGVFRDYPNPGEDSYMEIVPMGHLNSGGSDLYEVKFFVNPTYQFEVDYNMEHYYVDSNAVFSSWAWENLDDTLHNGFIALSQRNIDGSTANRELLQSYSGADAQVYGWFDTHWDVLANLNLYEYPGSISDPAFDANPDQYGHKYSAKVFTDITRADGGDGGESVDFYMENSPTDHSGLSYSTLRPNDWTAIRQVTRFTEDTAAGQRMITSLSSRGWNAEVYKESTELNDDGRIEFWSEKHHWYSAPSAALQESSATSRTHWLVEQADGSFFGEYRLYNGSWGSAYDISIGTDGSVYTQWAYSVTRSSGGNGLHFSIADPDNIIISLPGGTFSGAWHMGTLQGQYLSSSGGILQVSVSDFGYTDLFSGLEYDLEGTPVR